MPIDRFLADRNVTPERRHTLMLAYNHTLSKLNLIDRDDAACALVARKVMEIGANSTLTAVAIAELTVRQFAERNPPGRK
jgi:hypothetical protein